MSLRANRIVIAGEVKAVQANEKKTIAFITVEVPGKDQSQGDDAEKKMVSLIIQCRDAAAEVACTAKPGDFYMSEAAIIQQPTKADGKPDPVKVQMINAIIGTILLIPGAGATKVMAGGGLNLVFYAGTIVNEPKLEESGAKKTPKVYLSVACEPKYDRNQSKEERREATTYAKITAWGGLAKKWLHKAEQKDHLLVVGCLNQRKRTDLKRNGVEITETDIDIVDVSLESPANRSSGGGNGGDGGSKPGADDDLPF